MRRAVLRAIARSVQHALPANRGPPAGFDRRAVGLANSERFHHPVLRVPAARLASTAVEGEADPARKDPDAAEQPDSGAGDAVDASGERPKVRVIVTKKKVHPTDNAAVTKSLQELGAGGRHTQVVDLFERWRAGSLHQEDGSKPREFSPSQRAYALYLHSLCHGFTAAWRVQHFQDDAAKPLLQVLHEMDERGLSPRPIIFEPHATLARKRRFGSLGSTVLKEARRRGIALPVSILSDVLSSMALDFEDSRHSSMMESLLDEMQAHSNPSADIGTGASIRLRESLSAAASAAVEWSHAGIVRRALRLLADTGAKLELSLLVSAIDVGVDKHDDQLVSFAFARLEPATAAVTAIDGGTLLAVLNTAARTRSKALAQAAWEHICNRAQSTGTPPAPGLYAALAAARAACGDVEAAFAALVEAHKTHPEMTQNPSTWTAVIRACCGGPAALDGAYFILERLKNSGLAVPVAALNVVVAACGLSGDIQRAFETYEAFEPTFGVSPNLDTIHLLMDACTWNGRAGSVEQLQDVLKQLGLTPTSFTTSRLVDADIGQRRVASASSRAEAQPPGEMLTRQTLRRLHAALSEDRNDISKWTTWRASMAAADVKLN